MIEPKEINKVAAIKKVSDRQIEKDYVLSWVLYALSKNEILNRTLVFKGGTVLKKAYFEDYRFSEDLDFTLLDETISNEKLLHEFITLLLFIKEETNMDMQIDPNKYAIHDSGNLQFYIDYVASLKGNLGSRDLKIDITRGEVLETAPENRNVYRNYSDLENPFSLKCYSLEEILIEKMTALMGRTEPRDLFDFWYLTVIEKINVDENIISFRNKAKNKAHIPDLFFQKVMNKEAAFKRDWQRKLSFQIHDLPPFDRVFREAKRHFKF